MSEDREAKKLEKYKKQITLKPSFKKILRTPLLIAISLTVIICTIVAFRMWNSYEQTKKRVMLWNLESNKSSLEDEIKFFEDAGIDDKEKMRNCILWNMDEGQRHKDCLLINGKSTLTDDDLNVINPYLAFSYTLTDNTDDCLVGSEKEYIYMAKIKDTYVTYYNSWGGYEFFSESDVFAYKPDSKVLDKLYEWKKIVDEAEEHLERSSYLNFYREKYEIKLSTDMYIKGDKFVPCKLYLVCYGGDEKDDPIEKEIDSIDIVTNADEYDRWEYVTVDDKDDVASFSLCSDSVIGNFIEYKKMGDRIDDDNPDVVVKESVIGSDGHEYEIKLTGDYDIFADYGKKNVIKYLEILYGGSVIGMAAVVVIICFIVYRKRKAMYDIDLYKRTTGNAMAHDIKSPLMAVSGYAENMKENISEEERKEYAKKIVETVDEMNENIGFMDNLVKVQEGVLIRDGQDGLNRQASFGEKKINVWEEINTFIESNSGLIKNKRLDFNIQGECAVKCNEMWMDHLINNLLGNAVKYSKEGGQIDIQLNKKMIVVANDYEGQIDIKGDELKEAFVKGDNSRHTEGSGVGLSIVDSVVKRNGWKMNIETKDGRFVVKIKM